jgi:DNA excision repair protein ERCC-4
MVLYYDDREHADTIIHELSSYQDVSLIKKRLTLGDYQCNDWLIERKTLADLVHSLCDGRLFSQVARLAASFQHTALLIEGCTQDIANYQIHREALIGAICAISLNFHIPILRSLSQLETAKILYFCITQLHRNGTDIQLIGRKPKRRKTANFLYCKACLRLALNWLAGCCITSTMSRLCSLLQKRH